MQYRVEFDEEGLRVTKGEGTRVGGIRWDEVYRLTAHKVDAIRKEITFLTFDYSWGEFVEVTDQMTGFADLLRRLPEFLNLAVSNAATAVDALKARGESVTLFQK